MWKIVPDFDQKGKLTSLPLHFFIPFANFLPTGRQKNGGAHLILTMNYTFSMRNQDNPHASRHPHR